MILRCCRLSSCRCSPLCGLLLSNLFLLVEVLLKLRVNAKVATLKQYLAITKLSRLKVEEALRVKRLTLISSLEMEMRARATTCATALANLLTSNNPVANLYLTLREVGIVGSFANRLILPMFLWK